MKQEVLDVLARGVFQHIGVPVMQLGDAALEAIAGREVGLAANEYGRRSGTGTGGNRDCGCETGRGEEFKFVGSAVANGEHKTQPEPISGAEARFG